MSACIDPNTQQEHYIYQHSKEIWVCTYNACQMRAYDGCLTYVRELPARHNSDT
jgi:hypothetical protein